MRSFKEYKNGNYLVRIMSDGTKYRLSDNPIPEYPESIDVKITNKCNAGCTYCHEQSVLDGKGFDVDFANSLFKDLPNGIELAIGGGNPLEFKQDLQWLIRHLRNTIIFNLTINAVHLPMLEDVWGYNAVGISYRSDYHTQIVEAARTKPNAVIHLIAGVHTLEDLQKCLYDFDRVLVLGYKQVGRGIDYYNPQVETTLHRWKTEIGNYLTTDKVLVFDNLAITQLRVGRFYYHHIWDRIYMGNDGEFSMYLDLVEQKYAKSSRSEERYDIGDLSIKQMFQHIRSGLTIEDNIIRRVEV